MGTSVCSYHIRNCSRAKCLKALAQASSPRAVVSEMMDNWVAVVDEDCDAFTLKNLQKRVAKLSQLLEADILVTAVWDDDECYYAAYHAGKLLDRYASGKEWFRADAKGGLTGNPAKLEKGFAWWKGRKQLEAAAKKKILMESSRLQLIAEAFGIPRYRVMCKLKDFADMSHVEKFAALTPPDSYLGRSFRDQLAYVEFEPGR